MSLSTEEEMALEVLRGNRVVARALADKLCEEVRQGIHLPPVKSITCDINKLRCVIYFSLETAVEATIDVQGTQAAVEKWIEEGGHLVLVGVDRLELYEVSTA